MARPRLCLSAVALLTCLVTACAQEWTPGVGVTWSGVKRGNDELLANVHGYLYQGTTMAPLRGFAEALGAQVEYLGDGAITVRLGSTMVGLAVGVPMAIVGNEYRPMTMAPMVFDSVSCLPVRWLAETLGLTVQFGAQGSRWACAPHLMVSDGPTVFVMLVHRAPPALVARFIAQMQGSMQHYHDSDQPSSFRLGEWGKGWIIPLGPLASDGLHLLSRAPGAWQRDPNGPPGAMRFQCGRPAVYGIREGRWQFLTAFDERLTATRCERIGLPAEVAKEMGVL